ncbi:MAG TPA: iron-containing alcohol dehydrogenase family protein [Bacteroidales bacterium]|nr:iron-containing alcohol dehydrogenase family protein [Bacteroidales bacterium]
MYRIIKTVPKCAFGKGSFNQLGDILDLERKDAGSYVVILVDDCFRGKPLAKRVPLKDADRLIWVNVDEEPKTAMVDKIRDEILNGGKQPPSAIVGLGGGSVMDYAKAISVMLTNEGPASKYQGLNLAKNNAVFHVGIPTLSGTGAEVSMTAVLTGPEKKLGIKGEFTPFDLIILDPELIHDAPKNQRFYTGMDAYIHNVESLNGTNKNAISDSYAIQSQVLCREVFLNDNLTREEADEKLMVASYFGGLSIGYSEVGVCHALSYGLSYILGYHHGIANCIAFNQLEDVYGEDVKEFRAMLVKHSIDLPANISAKLTEKQISDMADISIKLEHMWKHAYGPDWQQHVDRKKIMDWFRRM